ncbi:MAG: hypothetical protein AB7R89_24635 [Dehalococcoidia bacterium]
MTVESARLSIAGMPAVAGACDLCAVEPAELNATVLVRHLRGGSVRFNACDRCAQAMRRVIAAIGGHGDVTSGPESAIPVPLEVPGVPSVQSPVLIGIVPDGLSDAAGNRFMIRLYGEERAGGTWISWIEFEAVATGETLRTERETTQSNREQLSYWASGLEPAYFDGAFARAR